MMERSWMWRRWAVFSSLGVCDAVILYITVFGADNRLNGDLVNAAFLLIAAIVNAYVFGSIWDDKIKGKENLASQAVSEGNPTTTNVEINQ